MANQIVSVDQMDQVGVILDAPASALAPNSFSDARNVRFTDSAVRKIEGEVTLNSIPADTNLDTIYGSSGNTLGDARYLAYWSNPNLGELAAYYVYIMAVKNSSGIHIADRIYLQDEEGNRADVTPTTLTNADGFKGFDPDGKWQHTLFAGGFAIIVNNGIQKPHYILDPISSINVANVADFSELPGWDSYYIDQTIISLDYDISQGNYFDLGQKVDFENFEVKVSINNVDFAVVSGTPAGTGTPNTANFVPGDAPAESVLVIASNKFEIYNNPNSLTTTIAIKDVSDTEPVIIKIVSRNNVNVRAGVVRAFGNLLVAGDLIEVDSVSNEIVRRLSGVVRTSDVAVTGSIPNNWNPFAAGVSTADEFTLSDTNIVQDMKSIQGNLYIYTNSSIHSMSLTGNSLAPVRFNLVTENYGAATTDSVLEYDGKHLVVGSNDIYVFPGHPGNIESIASGRIRNYFYNNLNPLHEHDLFCILNKAKDEIWICYPTIKSISGECDEAIIWNYRRNNWTIRDLDEVISGDIAPIRGGGIPLTTINIASGNSGSDESLNTGRQEVQTMTITGGMEASHSGIKQEQTYTVPTISSFGTDRPELIKVTITGDTGPNVVNAVNDITIGSTSSATVFTRSATIGGGFQLDIVTQDGTTATTTTIFGSDIFTTNDNSAKTQTQVVEALVTYINTVILSTNILSNYTASSEVDGSVTKLRLTSDVPGTRTITTVTATSYSGGFVSATGTGSDEQVSVTAVLANETARGYVKGTGTLVPYYSSGNSFGSNYGSTSANDRNGHVTARDAINELQVVIGGWTTAGANGPDGSNKTHTYTVARDGDVNFIISGSGGSGADHNYGGGAASAVQGVITGAVAGDTIKITAGGANRKDTWTGAGRAGKSSTLVWKRGSTTKATITAPGGRGTDNGTAAGQASAVSPSNAPSGVTYTRVLRGEGSTSSVFSGETNRGGQRNGGRGFFSRYGDNIYGGRYQTSSLTWQPSKASFGDGTQSHSDTPRCCTWNATPPGVGFLWQAGVRTDFTITNNRTVGSHALQQSIYDLHLAAFGNDSSSDISTINTGQTKTRSLIGDYVTTLNWTGNKLGTQQTAYNISGSASTTNAGSTGIDVTVTQNGAVYDINFTNNGVAPATITSPSAIADTDFQIGETKNLLGQSSVNWTLVGTYLTNTGTSSSVTATKTAVTSGVGNYSTSATDSPAIIARFTHSAGGYVPNGFTHDVQLTKNVTSSETISEQIVTALKQTPDFAGNDPRISGVTQPTDAYFYIEDNTNTNTFDIYYVKNVGTDHTDALSFSFLTKVGTTSYAETTFGGDLTVSETTANGASGASTSPIIRLSFDGTNVDTVIYGVGITQNDVAQSLSQTLENTGTFTATASGATVTAIREVSSGTANLIGVTVQSDPNNHIPAIPATFTQTVAGQNPSIGQGTATLTLTDSQFYNAYSIVVPLTGAYNTTLSATDIANLIRNTTVSGFTLGGSGTSVTFTTTDKYSVNRLDNGLGTGTVNNHLWTMTADDDEGVFAPTSNPLQNSTAVETTSGIPIRYSQPTVIRILYSDNSFQDYVFGGASNGPLAISEPYVANLYSGNTSSTTYTHTSISDSLETQIKIAGGNNLTVERTGNNLRIAPIQYSTDGMFITSATLTYLGTTAPSSKLVTAPVPATDATFSSTFSSFGRFDPDRPWATDQVKGGSVYPIFIQTNTVDDASRLRAADVGYTFGADPANNISGDPYISFVERRELGITPELDTEEIARAAIQSTGGTATELGGFLYYPTLYMRMTGSNYTAEYAELKSGSTLTNDYTVGSDYKIDTRITGRFINFRLDDADSDPSTASNQFAWGLSSIQFEVNKAGER